MEYRHLGRSGLKVSPVSLGSWLTYGRHVQPDTTDRIVGRAIDAGINLFDTADVYDRGRGEFMLGQALRGYRRDHLVIASKAYFPMSESPNDRGLSRKHLTESCEASLQRIGTDYLDLYQCHRFDDETPLEETVRTMGDLIARGKILYWGTSMWSAEQMHEACRLADAMNLPRPVSEQPRYSLIYREIESGVLAAGEELGIGMIVWSPLAQGLLTGKYRFGKPAPEGSRGADPNSNQFMTEDMEREIVFQLVERLSEIAADHGITLPCLALAWCLRQARVSSTIVGATTPEQLEQNVAAAEFGWSEAIEQAVRSALEAVPVTA